MPARTGPALSPRLSLSAPDRRRRPLGFIDLRPFAVDDDAVLLILLFAIGEGGLAVPEQVGGGALTATTVMSGVFREIGGTDYRPWSAYNTPKK
jgi:hypothetical protein